MSKIILSWLSYLTRENFDRRGKNHRTSIESLVPFANRDDIDIIVVDNSEPDNYACATIRDELKLPIKIFKAENVAIDVAVHYTGMLSALASGCEFFAYSYDDVIFYDHDFVSPAVEFMKQNLEVSCIRLSKYEHQNRQYYDTNFVPKKINPESVSHQNSRSNTVVHVGPYTVGDRTFYKSNWRPISKPSLWRTSKFNEIIGAPIPCPSLQPFERYMYQCSDNDVDWTSGFIDGGVCTTFPETTSERIVQGYEYTRQTPEADIERLMEMICNPKCWL